MDFSLLFFLICLSTRNPCTGTIYIIRTDTGVGCHGTGAGEVIPDITKSQPAGNHPAGLIKVIPLSVNVFPAIGSVAAVLMTIPPAGTALNPAGSVFYFSSDPCTGTIHIVISDPGISSHYAGIIHVVIFVVDQMPSGTVHNSVAGKIIPAVIDMPPSGEHGTGIVHIVSFRTRF